MFELHESSQGNAHCQSDSMYSSSWTRQLSGHLVSLAIPTLLTHLWQKPKTPGCLFRFLLWSLAVAMSESLWMIRPDQNFHSLHHQSAQWICSWRTRELKLPRVKLPVRPFEHMGKSANMSDNTAEMPEWPPSLRRLRENHVHPHVEQGV